MDKHNVVVHMIECFSAMKENFVLISAITWMTLENNVLSKRIQSQQITYYDPIEIWSTQNRQIYGEIESRLLAARIWGKGRLEIIPKGYRIWLEGNRNVVKLIMVRNVQVYEYIKIHLIIYFKWVNDKEFIFCEHQMVLDDWEMLALLNLITTLWYI